MMWKIIKIASLPIALIIFIVGFYIDYMFKIKSERGYAEFHAGLAGSISRIEFHAHEDTLFGAYIAVSPMGDNDTSRALAHDFVYNSTMNINGTLISTSMAIPTRVHVHRIVNDTIETVRLCENSVLPMFFRTSEYHLEICSFKMPRGHYIATFESISDVAEARMFNSRASILPIRAK